MLFCGIDLHSNNCFVVISDDDDRVLYSRRLPNNLTEICSALSPYQTELFGVVVESTYNWYWLVDGLIDAGYSLHLANTTAIKQYDGLKHRGDESDARHLAHILRLGLLPEGHIMPRPMRAVRDLARKRSQEIRHLPQHRQALSALGNHRACLCGAPICQCHRPIRLPAFRLAQDRGSKIPQAAAQPQAAPRRAHRFGIQGVLRQGRCVRQAMERGSNGVGQFSAQTNSWTMQLFLHRKTQLPCFFPALSASGHYAATPGPVLHEPFVQHQADTVACRETLHLNTQ